MEDNERKGSRATGARARDAEPNPQTPGEQLSRYVSEGNPATPEPAVGEALHPSVLPGRRDEAVSVKAPTAVADKDLADNDATGDVELAKQVKEAILKEGFLDDVSDGIHVTSRDGIVTLNGTVHTEQQRMSASDKAAAFAGFGNVHNQIQVAGVR